MRTRTEEYIRTQYGVSPEYPWDRDDMSAVFRHKDNRKWFALIMSVGRDRLGLPGKGTVNVINLKINDPLYHDSLVHEDGIMPAYHMNKRSWITVLLDGMVPEDLVFSLIDLSFSATGPKAKKTVSRPSKEWVIPANPKYYDVIKAFSERDEIEWKQGAGIMTGDTVYLYVGAPVSAILFKCKVTKTGIPCDFDNGKLKIRSLMSIKLMKRYKEDEFTFEVLREEYGIFAIRGPRGIPISLSEALM
ncbi:MAG: MmcQ/YjbR family DNA-binding protein [Clostridiales bacterium]|nr:MmcQ/YjbR family DNA-binding protein [Clostridiales bacterium]